MRADSEHFISTTRAACPAQCGRALQAEETECVIPFTVKEGQAGPQRHCEPGLGPGLRPRWPARAARLTPAPTAASGTSAEHPGLQLLQGAGKASCGVCRRRGFTTEGALQNPRPCALLATTGVAHHHRLSRPLRRPGRVRELSFVWLLSTWHVRDPWRCLHRAWYPRVSVHSDRAGVPQATRRGRMIDS